MAKNFIFVILIFLLISTVFSLISNPFQEAPKEISMRQLVKDINDGKVESILVSGEKLEITEKIDDKTENYVSSKEAGTNLSETLLNLGAQPVKLEAVSLSFESGDGVWSWLMPVLITVVPLLLFVAFFFLIFRQARTGAMQAFDFTKAKAKLFGSGSKEKTSFKDVAGLKEAKEELEEVVDFLKNPKKYLQMGARIPRGVLLVGPPGTGKTLLARAVASEANVPFFSISGSEFIELFVGVGASRVRNLFEEARKAGKAIIFIDEIDSIGKTRGVGVTGGHEEREQTLNQILAEMDGIGREEGVIVMGATNRPEYLDPALLRPGRFDRRITLDLPDINDREAIIKIHCQGKPLTSDVNLRELAERTPGFSGADLANLANEAAILAARRNKTQIAQGELLESIEKVMLGPERKSHILSKPEKEIAAYHEAGHALMSVLVPNSEPVRKVSIVARGMAAGYTLKVPIEEKKLKTKAEFKSELSVLLGGYYAELLKFGDTTTGAANDLEKASVLARKMVKEFGMSKLGPISFGEREESIFLGRELGEYKNYSEKIASEIDSEVAKFISEAESVTREMLTKKRNILDKIAKTLVEKETIEKEEFERLIGEKTGAEKISKRIK